LTLPKNNYGKIKNNMFEYCSFCAGCIIEPIHMDFVWFNPFQRKSYLGDSYKNLKKYKKAILYYDNITNKHTKPASIRLIKLIKKLNKREKRLANHSYENRKSEELSW
jgi:hypothetical protein